MLNLKQKLSSLNNLSFKDGVKLVIFKINIMLAQKFLYPSAQKRAAILGFSLYDAEFEKAFGVKHGKEISDEALRAISVEAFLPFNVLEEGRAFLKNELKPEIPASDITSHADEICMHKFDILGSGKTVVSYNSEYAGVEGHIYKKNHNYQEITSVKNSILDKMTFLGIKSEHGAIEYEPIDWHTDFKSGYSWDKNIWYRNIKYGNAPGVDVKVPWELSRMQHLVRLGTAYFLTEDEKYSIEFMSQVIDWVENNRPETGVNWKCTMDVGIRAANLIFGFSYFANSPYITKRFKSYFLKTIYIHGRHIIKNLELGSITSNHYLSDIAGLAIIGIFLSGIKTGKKWKSFAINEIKKEMSKQVYADGVDFESSSCYHRLVLELMFYAVFYLLKSNDLPIAENYNNSSGASVFYNKGNPGYMKKCVDLFGKDFTDKLYKMFDFILCLSKQNGEIPQMGDNDNGRFVIFGSRSLLDVRYLATYAAIFFKEPHFKIRQWGFSQEALWVFGKDGRIIWEGLDFNDLENINSISFKDGGIYIMRDHNNYMALNCGPNGQNGNGGHCHNDKLSFELQASGKDIFCDPGTYLYTPSAELRNLFRSTAFHNTITIDMQEQNRFFENNLFSIHNDSDVGVRKFEDGEDLITFDAWHTGYKRLAEPVEHRRRILYSKKGKFWLINDLLEGQGEHYITLNFHLYPELTIAFGENSSDIFIVPNEDESNGSGECFLELPVNLPESSNLNPEKYFIKMVPLSVLGMKLFVQRGYYSPCYGKKIPSKILKFSGRLKLPSSLVIGLFCQPLGSTDLSAILELLENKF